MVMRYPDSRNKNSITQGEEFVYTVINTLARYNIYLESKDDLYNQYKHGDAVDNCDNWYEIKLDRNCVITGRLSIEIAERTALHRGWVDSGIFAQSDATYYVQGTFSKFWVFRRQDLQEWYNTQNVSICADNPPTIKKYWLYLEPALKHHCYLPIKS